MFQGFKDFILRGNVIELAVAVVVGSAFQTVVDNFVSAIVEPVINAAGNPQTAGLGFSIRNDTPRRPRAHSSTSPRSSTRSSCSHHGGGCLLRVRAADEQARGAP